MGHTANVAVGVSTRVQGTGPAQAPSLVWELLPLAILLQQALRSTWMWAGQGLSSTQAWNPIGPSSQHGLRLVPAYQLGYLGQAVNRLRVSASPTTEQGRGESLLHNVPLRIG